MDLATLLPWIQIVVSFVLVALVLMSQSDAGLGGAFGGSDGSGGHRTKRGLEKTVFYATIFAGILFGILAIISLFLAKGA